MKAVSEMAAALSYFQNESLTRKMKGVRT